MKGLEKFIDNYLLPIFMTMLLIMGVVFFGAVTVAIVVSLIRGGI